MVVKPRSTGVRRMIKATFYSIAGLRAAWVHEAAFRQECIAAAALAPIAWWLGQDAVQRALLLGTCLLVIVVELLNSAVEAVVDRVGADHHDLAGRAKDMSSAAVMVSLVLTAVVWSLIGWERFA